MATEISQDAQAVVSGAPEGFKDYAMQNAPGDKLTSGEATRLLDKYNASADNVFTTENIQGEEVLAPDDLLGIRKQIQGELGVPELQKQFQEQYAGLNKYDQMTEEQQRQIEEERISMNVIRGAQATASRLRALERSGLARALDVSQTALQAAQQEATAQYAIREKQVDQKRELILQYPGAGITWGDSVEAAAQKAYDFGKREAEEERKRQYKQELKRIALSVGASLKTKKGGTAGIKNLEKNISKVNKRAAEEAKRMADLDYKMKVQQLENLRIASQPAEKINPADFFSGGGGNIVTTASSPASGSSIDKVLSGFNMLNMYRTFSK